MYKFLKKLFSRKKGERSLEERLFAGILVGEPKDQFRWAQTK